MSRILGQFQILIALVLGFAIANPLPAFADGSSPQSLKVLSINVWILKLLTHSIGKDINARMQIIPEAIARTGADIVALQEIWPDRYKKRMRRALRERGYKYFAYESKGMLTLGNGLAIASRYPISNFRVAPLYREHTRFDEKLAEKRAIAAEIALPSGEKIDFVTTHVGALTYDKEEGQYKPNQRLRQLEQYEELRDWIRSERRNKKLIFAGDMNANYTRLVKGKFLPEFDSGYLGFIENGCADSEDFLNTFLVANQKTASSVEEPTYDSKNPYVAAGYFADAPSETEDYIFTCGITEAAVRRSKVMFKDPIIASDYPDVKFKKVPLRISDHYGVMTEFEI